VHAVIEPPGGNALPSASVVICAYTEARWDDLVAAVRSVQAQDLPVLETVLVIDHNPALHARAAREIPGIVLVENAEQRGLSGARNSGVRVARGDVIAFIDDDAWAEPGWWGALAAVYADPLVMAAGGGIVPAWEAGRPAWFPPEFDWVIGCTYRGMPQGQAAVRNMIGCNMSFRREAFEEVGSFSHGIGRIGTRPLGGEETELCIRAQRRWPDRVILYEPSAIVNHRVPAARGTVGYFRSRCYAEGLSKAAIAKLVGSGRALATERGYAVRTLGGGFLRNLADTVRGAGLAGPRRAGAIVLGLLATTAGYVVGRVSARPLTDGPQGAGQ
jgi:glycosyltransferase involved in cell wall biosynthesis